MFSAFQLTFAVITVALISGAIADRTKFGAWTVFTVAWATLVYFPVAHWVWGGGWLTPWASRTSRAAPSSTSTPVPLAWRSPGARQASRLGQDPMRPHNLPLVLLGAGLLWFGGSASTRALSSA